MDLKFFTNDRRSRVVFYRYHVFLGVVWFQKIGYRIWIQNYTQMAQVKGISAMAITLAGLSAVLRSMRAVWQHDLLTDKSITVWRVVFSPVFVLPGWNTLRRIFREPTVGGARRCTVILMGNACVYVVLFWGSWPPSFPRSLLDVSSPMYDFMGGPKRQLSKTTRKHNSRRSPLHLVFWNGFWTFWATIITMICTPEHLEGSLA